MKVNVCGANVKFRQQLLVVPMNPELVHAQALIINKSSTDFRNPSFSLSFIVYHRDSIVISYHNISIQRKNNYFLGFYLLSRKFLNKDMLITDKWTQERPLVNSSVNSCFSFWISIIQGTRLMGMLNHTQVPKKDSLLNAVWTLLWGTLGNYFHWSVFPLFPVVWTQRMKIKNRSIVSVSTLQELALFFFQK